MAGVQNVNPFKATGCERGTPAGSQQRLVQRVKALGAGQHNNDRNPNPSRTPTASRAHRPGGSSA